MTHNTSYWRCDCGAVEFELAAVKGTRCICYCADCRAFLTHLGRGKLTDAAGGTDLFQTTPDKLQITKGAEHLACLRLSEKGPLRWHATCCNTPICNTGASRAVPLASMMVRSFDEQDAIGPVIARIHRKGATARVEGDAGSLRKFILSFAGSAALSLVTGRYRKTPFFDAKGRPVTKPKRLEATERAAAYGS